MNNNINEGKQLLGLCNLCNTMKLKSDDENIFYGKHYNDDKWMCQSCLNTLHDNDNDEFDNRMKIYKQAWDKFGKDAQLFQVVEEFGELLVAINKHRRYNTELTKERLIEEIVDSNIMIEQLIMHYNLKDKIDDLKNKKLDKLKKYLTEK